MFSIFLNIIIPIPIGISGPISRNKVFQVFPICQKQNSFKNFELNPHNCLPVTLIFRNVETVSNQSYLAIIPEIPIRIVVWKYEDLNWFRPERTMLIVFADSKTTVFVYILRQSFQFGVERFTDLFKIISSLKTR